MTSRGTSAPVEVSAVGDREIVMTRTFNAPRRLVWDALSRPELVRRWLLGPDGWAMPICEIDFRVGGKYRYVWRKEKTGEEMGMGGVYREIVPFDRIVSTELFDNPWYPGEAVGTAVLVEKAGKTTLTTRMRYATTEARDGVIKSGMARGVEDSYARLEAIITGDGA